MGENFLHNTGIYIYVRQLYVLKFENVDEEEVKEVDNEEEVENKVEKKKEEEVNVPSSYPHFRLPNPCSPPPLLSSPSQSLHLSIISPPRLVSGVTRK